MFNRYYQEELDYVRKLGRLFAEVNPALAPFLAERSSDPDVERLIEGFAFLTARIRERIDDASPEIVHNLIELLLPHYLRPIPAATIVEFLPIPGSLRRRQTIAAHSEVATAAIKGTACRFRTTASIDVLPLSLVDLKLEDPGSSRPRVRITLESTVKEGRNEALQKTGIRFFIHGEPAATTTFYLWVSRYLDNIRISSATRREESVRLSRKHFRPVGASPSFPLLPWSSFAPDGYRVLQEYFALPQKLLFFDLIDLDIARERIQDDRFEITLELGPQALEGEVPKMTSSIGKTFLRLHCAPVVNLFNASAEPIRRRVEGTEHLLRAAMIDQRHVEVHSVERVVGIEQGQGRTERKTYEPFFSFQHTPGSEYYQLRRALSPLNDGIDTYLSIIGARDVTPEAIEREELSLDLLCTNRSLPATLAAGDLSVATPTSPTFATFKNITGVSKPARPPLGTELHWRLVAHLAINRRSVTEAGMISALLSLYELVGSSDEGSARAARLKIESIRSVVAEEARRIVQGVAVRGVMTTVELDESAFTGPGDAFVFGTVLDEVLASRIAMNTFNELRLRLSPSGRTIHFDPRGGAQKVL